MKPLHPGSLWPLAPSAAVPPPCCPLKGVGFEGVGQGLASSSVPSAAVLGTFHPKALPLTPRPAGEGRLLMGRGGREDIVRRKWRAAETNNKVVILHVFLQSNSFAKSPSLTRVLKEKMFI